MIKKISVSLVACILLPALLHAQDFLTGAPSLIKCGVVDTDTLIKASQKVRQAQQKIEAEFRDRDEDLSRRAKEWRKLAYQLDVAKDEKNDSKMQELQKELDELRPSFQQDTKAFKSDLEKRKKEELAAILNAASRAANTIASQRNFQKMFQTSEKEPFYVAPGAAQSECSEKTDVTAEVLSLLDKNVPDEQPDIAPPILRHRSHD